MVAVGGAFVASQMVAAVASSAMSHGFASAPEDPEENVIAEVEAEVGTLVLVQAPAAWLEASTAVAERCRASEGQDFEADAVRSMVAD